MDQGGATSFAPVPYMLELRPRHDPLRGSLLAGMARRMPANACGQPLRCVEQLGASLLERSLAGLNRLMELGVDPLARLFWAPRPGVRAQLPVARAPFREPVITADPRLLRLRQQLESQPQPAATLQASSMSATMPLPVAPELPPPTPPPRPTSGAVGSGAPSETTPQDLVKVAS